MEEGICYPQGIDHNITSASKLFIWRSRGNKKLLLSYGLYLGCPSSSGSTCLTVCTVCVCLLRQHVFAFWCVHHPIAICVGLVLFGRFMFSIPLRCYVEIEMCSLSPGGISYRFVIAEVYGQPLCVCVCVYAHTPIYICFCSPPAVFMRWTPFFLPFCLCLLHHPLQFKELKCCIKHSIATGKKLELFFSFAL